MGTEEVLTVKLVALFAVLLAAASALTQEPKFYRVEFAPVDSIPQSVHFFCSQGYDREDCRRDVAALRKALAQYPLELLGEWSFYMVLAPEWKPLARNHGGPAVSPAFTLLLQPSSTEACSPARPTAIHRDDVALEPRPVSTMRVPPPEELPAPHVTAPATPAASAAAPAAEASVGQRIEPDTARVNLLAAAESVDAAATSPAADDASDSSSSMAIKVLALIGVCAGAAVGFYGLLMLNTRRRHARRMGLAPPRRNPAGRPLPQRDDRLAERVAQQRLFPHQFGSAIRG